MSTTVRGFTQNHCALQASALTYYSLLALVPVLAMLLGVAKGFNLDLTLEAALYQQFPEHGAVIGPSLEFARKTLARTQGGVIAGVGVLVLFWSVTMMLSHIETAFNDIWKITRQRSWVRRFSDYLTMTLVLPLLFVGGSSLTVVVRQQPYLPELVLLKLIPFVLTGVLFTLVYVVMPNRRVPFGAALLAGFAAGTVYQLIQLAYIGSQLLANQYGAIYGSFAALPLFLIWVQLSWLVLLAGAELAYAMQYVSGHDFYQDIAEFSSATRRLLAVAVTRACARHFHGEEKTSTITHLARQLDLPVSLTQQVVTLLEDAGVLVQVNAEDVLEPLYQPARPADQMTVKTVIDALDHHGVDAITYGGKELKATATTLQELNDLIITSPANLPLIQESGE